jgi:osmotically inducible protein OsmC
VHFNTGEGGPKIERIELTTRGSVPGLDEAGFKEAAEAAKANCPVSQALTGVQIELDAALA